MEFGKQHDTTDFCSRQPVTNLLCFLQHKLIIITVNTEMMTISNNTGTELGLDCWAGGRVWTLAVFGHRPCLDTGRFWTPAVSGHRPCLNTGRVWTPAVFGHWPYLDTGRVFFPIGKNPLSPTVSEIFGLKCYDLMTS